MTTCRNTTGKPAPDLCSKYCSDHPFETPCDECGEPVAVTYGRLEVIGPYHSGCFGYPACACSERHRGECPATPRHGTGCGGEMNHSMQCPSCGQWHTITLESKPNGAVLPKLLTCDCGKPLVSQGENAWTITMANTVVVGEPGPRHSGTPTGGR